MEEQILPTEEEERSRGRDDDNANNRQENESLRLSYKFGNGMGNFVDRLRDNKGLRVLHQQL